MGTECGLINNLLLSRQENLVKTRESCQPDQAVEPLASTHTSPCASSPTGTTSDSQDFFVPVQAKRRKTKKKANLMNGEL